MVKIDDFFVGRWGVGRKLRFEAGRSNSITLPSHPPLTQQSNSDDVDDGNGNDVAGNKEGNGKGSKSDGYGNKEGDCKGGKSDCNGNKEGDGNGDKMGDGDSNKDGGQQRG